MLLRISTSKFSGKFTENLTETAETTIESFETYANIQTVRETLWTEKNSFDYTLENDISKDVTNLDNGTGTVENVSWNSHSEISDAFEQCLNL